jgi:Calx-beta domain/Domain of unknown function (DUF4214)
MQHRRRLRMELLCEELENRQLLSTIQFGSALYLVGEAKGQAQITVSREGAASGSESVDYSTSDDSATTARYTETHGSLIFLPGETSKIFAVPITNDSLVNHNQTVELHLGNPGGGATLGPNSTAVLNILDDELPFDLASIDNVIGTGNYRGHRFGTDTASLQYAPDGSMNQLIWIDPLPADSSTDQNYELIYLHRNGFGDWIKETVASPGWRFGSNEAHAQMVYDSAGACHVLVFTSTGDVIHYRRDPGGWNQVERVSFPSLAVPQANQAFALAAAMGKDHSLHVAVATNALYYVTNQSGTWQEELVTPQAKGCSIAIDSQDVAHIAYSIEQPANYSQLAYATNRGGAWATQTIGQSSFDWGSAGQGFSLAIGPNDLPAIASFSGARAATGPPLLSSGQLLFQQELPSGSWQSEVVSGTSDGYVIPPDPASANFTGNAPQLQFDSQGRPQILFTDVAVVDWNSTTTAGNLRTAVKTSAGWQFARVYGQFDPLYSQFAPAGMALALSGSGSSGTEVITYGTDKTGNSFKIVEDDPIWRLHTGVATNIAKFFVASTENYQYLVDTSYERYLRRAPGPNEENYWVGRLQKFGEGDYEALDAGLLASAEYIKANGGADASGHAGIDWLQGMYRDVLGRQGEPLGLTYWSGRIQEGLDPYQVAIGFSASEERRASRVREFYTQYLDRFAEDAGERYWTQVLVSNPNFFKHILFPAGILSSAEYYFNRGHGDTASWIRSLYRDMLRREATSSEVDYWMKIATS